MRRNISNRIADLHIGAENLLPIVVCMHVLRAARHDVRAMRAASALMNAGASVSIIDLESQQEVSAEETIDGIQIKHLLISALFGTVRFEQHTLIKASQLFLRSLWLLLRTPADIYHACEVTALPACYLAARLRRKPLIFEAYELPLGDYPIAKMGRSRRIIHRLLQVLLAHIIPRCAGVISVSPPIVQAIKQQYAINTVSLVRNILPYRRVAKTDRLRQLLGLNQDVRIALYQGYLQPDRSLDILVRAGAFLASKHVIVLMGKGVGTTLTELQALIAHQGISDRVKILPPVPYEELLDWTASADIGLIISAPDYTPNIEMLLPNKLFEYMMAGLPILTSQLPAIIEIITAHDVGRVVSSLAPADVGFAINELLANTSDLNRMHENALRTAKEQFHWEKESAELIRFYREIAGC